MLLDVVHYFCLLVTDIEGSRGSVPWGGEVGPDGLFVGGVNITYSLIENDLSFSTHQLQH